MVPQLFLKHFLTALAWWSSATVKSLGQNNTFVFLDSLENIFFTLLSQSPVFQANGWPLLLSKVLWRARSKLRELWTCLTHTNPLRRMRPVMSLRLGYFWFCSRSGTSPTLLEPWPNLPQNPRRICSRSSVPEDQTPRNLHNLVGKWVQNITLAGTFRGTFWHGQTRSEPEKFCPETELYCRWRPRSYSCWKTKVWPLCPKASAVVFCGGGWDGGSSCWTPGEEAWKPSQIETCTSLHVQMSHRKSIWVHVHTSIFLLHVAI